MPHVCLSLIVKLESEMKYGRQLILEITTSAEPSQYLLTRSGSRAAEAPNTWFLNKSWTKPFWKQNPGVFLSSGLATQFQAAYGAVPHRPSTLYWQRGGGFSVFTK